MEPVGMHEIAVMLGVSRQRVAQLVATRGFPKPWDDRMAMGKVWEGADIEAWAQAGGRQLVMSAKAARRGRRK